MAEKDLRPFGRGFRSESEEKRLQAKGGINSGKKRRWQAEQRERLRSLMGMRLTPELISKLREQGAEIPDGATMSDGMDAAMMIAAMLGDPKAYDVVNQYAGKAKKTDAEQEIVESQASAASGEDDAAADDGFIQALNASAAEDWSDSDRVGTPDLSEDNGKPKGGEAE